MTSPDVGEPASQSAGPLASSQPCPEVLFLGGVFPPDEESAIVSRSRGPIQNAANALQWSLITGFDAVLAKPASILNAVFVGSFPRLYTDIWIRARRWSHGPGARDESVGFLNVFGVKHLWRTAALAAKAGRWAASSRGAAERAIVMYSMHAPFMIAAAIAKRLDPSLTICMVVPDLPEHMNLADGYGGVLRALKAIDRWVMDRVMKRIDCFVLLTRHMAEPLGVARRPWIVMEGAVNPLDVPSTAFEDAAEPVEKVILYTGTLHKAYGILDLLDAFALIPDPSCRLWICGAGDAESEVRAMAARDSRVRYVGQVNRSAVLSLQREATVLVNPRGDAAEFTKYSFPSKTLEYMLSGRPAVARKLPGIPEEYFEHLFAVDGPSPGDLARKIFEVCEMPAAERRRRGEGARRFALEQKSGSMQARRILELIRRSRPGLRGEVASRHEASA